LQIEVCLQNRSRVLATLKHYDLRYNVAVVDIICFRSPRAIELEKDIPFAPNTDVVAVGFCFKGCKLMATKGVLVDKPSKLDCKDLGTPHARYKSFQTPGYTPAFSHVLISFLKNLGSR